MDEAAEPELYEIRIRGVLSERLLGAFPDLEAETRGGETVLRGALPDQAALHGVFAQIGALGLELLEVRSGRPRAVQQLLRCGKRRRRRPMNRLRLPGADATGAAVRDVSETAPPGTISYDN